MAKAKQNSSTAAPVMSNGELMKRRIWRNKELYLLVLPVIIYYLIFHYKPMYGLIIAFQDYSPRRGISGSEWVGFQHFTDFFTGIYFGRLLRNTLEISLATLIFGFPAPILLALLVNELRSKWFSRITQTITYMPHFVSMVVLCAMIREFVKEGGLVTDILSSVFGYDGKNLLSRSAYFTPIYVITNIWQGVGWGSIVYLAALTGIDMELYEAARVDGANRWKQTIHITIPSIMPTIIIMLIMRMGQIMGIGHEKIILLYNEGIYERADVISTYVYRMGIMNRQYSFSSAVGLFNSVVNFILVIGANQISKKVSETSLW
ncbi:MAG: sugar ABC transporter permease [Lachnospiraceae bacterium]|nr:sugar ABC transporter permease [Lachnospiraceae bacterium]